MSFLVRTKKTHRLKRNWTELGAGSRRALTPKRKHSAQEAVIIRSNRASPSPNTRISDLRSDRFHQATLKIAAFVPTRLLSPTLPRHSVGIQRHRGCTPSRRRHSHGGQKMLPLGGSTQRFLCLRTRPRGSPSAKPHLLADAHCTGTFSLKLIALQQNRFFDSIAYDEQFISHPLDPALISNV